MMGARMGRKYYTERMPQHSRHGRQRRWSGEGVSRMFTVQRTMQADSAIRIMTGIRALQIAGDLPDDLEFKPRIRVELVPTRLIAEQAMKGIVHLDGNRLRRLERKFCRKNEGDVEPVAGEIRSVSMKRGSQLRLILASEALETERTEMADVLESVGFRGMHRERLQTSLHINLAGGRPDQLSLAVRSHAEAAVLEVIDQVHPLETPVLFGDLAINPPDALAA